MGTRGIGYERTINDTNMKIIQIHVAKKLIGKENFTYLNSNMAKVFY